MKSVMTNWKRRAGLTLGLLGGAFWLACAGAPAGAAPITYDVVDGFYVNQPSATGEGQTQQGIDNWWYHEHASPPWDNFMLQDDPSQYNLMTYGQTGAQYTPIAWQSSAAERPSFRNGVWDTVRPHHGTTQGDAIEILTQNYIQPALEWRADQAGFVDVSFELRGDAHDDNRIGFHLFHWDALTGEATTLNSAVITNQYGGINAPYAMMAGNVPVAAGDSIFLYAHVGAGMGDSDGYDRAALRGQIVFIPEPTSLGLLGFGAVMLLLRRRRRQA